MKKVLLTFMTLFAGNLLIASNSITLTPDAVSGKDVMIVDYLPTNNLGTHPDLQANAWTFSPTPGVLRSLIQFDYSSLPNGAVVTSAYLSLFESVGSNSGDHSTTSGSNEAWLQRVTSNWDETTVTWATQPSTTTANEITLPASTSANQNYPNIDVTLLVQDMVNSGNNYGFMLRLVTEQHYRRLNFASSDNSNSALHPSLVINYTLPITFFTLQPDPKAGEDAIIIDIQGTSNFGTHPDLQANAWTFSPTPGVVRSLLKFDYSAIPANAIIDSALLSLYESVGSGSGDHSQQSGSNEAWLQRVTGPWSELTVNWSTQPSTTTDNEVTLPASTSANENYLDIDVKNLVEDMINSDNYGFMIRLVTEQHYRRLNFASSDNANTALHPSLKVCYNDVTGIVENKIPFEQLISLYPNPANDKLFIEANGLDVTQINIYNTTGNLVNQIKQLQNKSVGISELSSGIYIAEIVSKEASTRKKFIKM